MLIYIFFSLTLLLLFGLSYLVYTAKNIPFPIVENTNFLSKEIQKKDGRIYYESSFLQKNEFGFYELYIEGGAFNIGVAMGKISQELKYEHEKNFIASIHEIVPNKTYLNFLRLFIGIFNRNLHKFFKKEYLDEIYGLSLSSSSDFNYIAPPYQRVLNYHAAHDIGHALQNIGLVGCSSFVVKGSRSENQELLLARNLDFSPSEAFNELKALYFMHPEKGHKYISYSWPGFIGVVSGMNEHGLCVVLHAAKSKMSFSIGTPVSIIAKEILQYAKNLEETRAILKSKTSFVSELFLVVSALDKSAIVFEKEPKSLTEYQMEGEELLCLNHLQSKERISEKENLEWQKTISSGYREKRLKELLKETGTINPLKASEILRNIKGHSNEDIGLENENAMNQLAAHHGIIFQPESKNFWVSANPFMMGEMVAYNLDDAFKKAKNHSKKVLYLKDKTIPKDTFLSSEAYQNFLAFKTLKKQFQSEIKKKKTVSLSDLQLFESLNPNLFLTYEIVGDYYKSQKESKKAKEYYQKALNLSIPTLHEKSRIEKKCQKT